MKCKDPKLQQHCDRVLAIMVDLPMELREICALMDAHYWFNLIEGNESPQVQEAFKQLTSQEKRSALRLWYSRLPTINQPVDEFRRKLAHAIGEELPLGRAIK